MDINKKCRGGNEFPSWWYELKGFTIPLSITYIQQAVKGDNTSVQFKYI